MAEINQEQIEEIVAQVIRNLRHGGQLSSSPTQSSTSGASQPGVFPTVDQAIGAAKEAQTEFVKLGFAKRKEIIQAIKGAALEHAKRLAELAVKDTKMGTVEHKTMKNEGAVNLSPGV